MNTLKRIWLIALCCFIGTALAFGQNKIPWRAFDASGAGKGTQGSRMLYSSFGQPLVGVSTQGPRVLNSGYLYIRTVPQGAPFLLTQASVNFGTVIVGNSTQQTLTIQNTGGAPLIISSTSINTPEFTFVSGNGPQTIPAGGSANIVLRFTPANIGNRAGTLTINSNASNGASIGVTLNGVGQASAPNLVLSTNALDFGSVTVGNNSVRSVSLSNTGNASLTISNQAVSGANASDFTITHLSAGSIAAAGSDFIEIRFTPAASGARSASLSFNTNDVNFPSVTVTLSGQGTLSTQPRISLSASLVDFGTTTPGTPITRDVVISNTGTANLTLSTQNVSGTGFTLTNPATATIAPGGNATATLQFNPPSSGNWIGAFNISSNDPISPTATVNLRGTGGSVSGPRISLSRSSIDFGNVPVLTPREEDIIVRNIGSSDLVISSQTITGTDAIHFGIVTPAGTPIAAGAQTTARIRHLPLNAGNKIAFYRLQTNDPGASTVDVALVSTAVGVEKLPVAPSGILLHQNYPNPFTDRTTIVYESDAESLVQLDVFNMLGARVATLVNERQSAGVYQVSFETAQLPAGSYTILLRVSTERNSQTLLKTMSIMN